MLAAPQEVRRGSQMQIMPRYEVGLREPPQQTVDKYPWLPLRRGRYAVPPLRA